MRAQELPTNIRPFRGWLAQDVVADLNEDGTVSLQGIPLPAFVVRPYDPKPGDDVEVLRGRTFAIVLRKLPTVGETGGNGSAQVIG